MNWAEQWRDTVIESFRQLGATVAGVVPNVIGMLIILILGYVVSKVLQRVATVVSRKVGFDTAADRAGIQELLSRMNVTISASQILGKLVFWLFMLTFLVSAAETLGLDNVTRTIDSFVGYLPNVIGAVVIIVAGLLLAQFVRNLVRSGAEGVGVEYAEALGRLAYGILLVIVVSLAVGQLKIETELINRIVELAVLTGGAALALTLALGTRDLVKNIIAGFYARDIYEPGMRLTLAEHEGSLTEIGTVKTVISTTTGEQIYVPNSQLLELVVRGGPARDA